MQSKEIYSKYFSPLNLRLAWERVIRSNGRDVKDYWGIEIYGSKLEDNLKNLSDRIISGNFKPSRPFKYYEPKASGTLRTKSILPIEDALVYQAMADTIATNNYSKLTDNNHFVFGSILHQEVKLGVDLLDKEDAELFFFEYYLPNYNKFVESVNKEIGNESIRFMLETDITGFFDSIPHSKLLMALHQHGVEPELLDFMEECLNMYSGTRESITPGVGIPQGPAASFFLANLFLNDLDQIINRAGYTYYRYMDDIRIYEESQDDLLDVLVTIDKYLKGCGLSLNSKKTSIEIIEDKDREIRKLKTLHGSYGQEIDPVAIKEIQDSFSDFIDQETLFKLQIQSAIEVLTEEELIEFCKNEVRESAAFFRVRFRKLNDADFDKQFRKLSDAQIKEIFHQTYRWRNGNRILSEYDKPILEEYFIDIWFYLMVHLFWKANHFCWNLNLYEEKKSIVKRLLPMVYEKKLNRFEWVKYQILFNLADYKNWSTSELKRLYRFVTNEESPLVRLGLFTVLLKQVEPGTQLFTSIKNAIKDEKEPYLKETLSGLMYKRGDFDVIKYWLGI